ncbi:MAG: chemotaxis response regulator protein-glutamate methylesterase [Spirochaetes bacterium]|nr:chemotaxis response regulator protein-glutamate methylesterase [Spirochaetota bacterium]
MSGQIKVLVVDDSTLVRKIVTDSLESDPMIKVIGAADNGEMAVKLAKELNPDVITMDIEMPVMDGLTALRTIIATNPKPVIMLSVFTKHGAEETFKALEYGAVDFIPKPSSMVSLSLNDISELLRTKVKSVSKSKVDSKETPVDKRPAGAPAVRADIKAAAPILKKTASTRIVGIGTSTGGPAALIQVFTNIPPDFPSSILVVQHMPEGFTKAFAERLDLMSQLKVKEAQDMDQVLPGCAFVAPGNKHIALEEKNNNRYVRVFDGEKVSGHRPSIDVLFNSLADTAGKNTVAVIMTGMGRDGADGITRIKKTGGKTIAQNEETSVVYGMNRVAVEKGGIDDVVPLSEIPKKIVEYI